MINFVSTRDYLIPPICIQTSVSRRRLYIGQFLSLHFKDRDEVSSAKDQRIYYMITKYFHAPWNYQMILLVSFWFLFCFVLFSFGTYLWPVLTKNAQKAFVHMKRINCSVTTLYEVFNRLQAFLFFPFWGINEGIKRKHILHSLVADQSTGFLARSRVPPQRRNSREIG